MRYLKTKQAGFTLPEILIALAVFSILSVLLMTALSSVIGSQQKTEEKAQRLRDMQMGLLVFSRDVSQAIARSTLNFKGVPVAPFVGDATSFSFTHMGYANFNNNLPQSNLQRVQYSIKENTLVRTSWDYLDLAPKSTSHQRELIEHVEKINFQFIDDQGRMHDEWDLQTAVTIPRGILMTLTIDKWGTMSQVFVISGAASVAQTKDKPS
jgi:general secretion pathway protein J